MCDKKAKIEEICKGQVLVPGCFQKSKYQKSKYVFCDHSKTVNRE